MPNNDLPHVPIMVDTVLRGFSGLSCSTFYEGTVGAGGHAKEILATHPEIERYIGCDRDPEALEIARQTLLPWEDKVELIHGNFADLDQQLAERKIEQIDGFFLIWEFHPCS